MDFKMVSQQIIKIIDERVEKYFLQHDRSSRESMATVLKVNKTMNQATVQFVDNEAVTMVLTNKSGEVLSVGDSVYVSWRGMRTSNTAFISRRVGVPVYPIPSGTNVSIQKMTEEQYNALNSKDMDTLYVVCKENGTVTLYLGEVSI